MFAELLLAHGLWKPVSLGSPQAEFAVAVRMLLKQRCSLKLKEDRRAITFLALDSVSTVYSLCVD